MDMTGNGSIFAELRRAAGYTQKALADALGITDKAVSKWERGICNPDSALLPRLSLLLGTDFSLLLSNGKVHESAWFGLMDLGDNELDLSERVYDKPMVYFLLTHFLLLGIRTIYIRASKENEAYLSKQIFSDFGFHFIFGFSDLPRANMMIMNRPFFLFGSDLTRIFQGTMIMDALVKLVPANQKETFLFCPAEYTFLYKNNPDSLYQAAASKTLGRGMISVDMDNIEGVANAASFVRFYQNNTGLALGNLLEISTQQRLIKKS